MKKTDLNAHQLEAIANADAHTSNAGLPTYSDLQDILQQAIARVEIANNEGNPILSAWLIDAHTKAL